MKPGLEGALRWLRQAEHDLAIAHGHQQRGDFSDACFMAEQAAQKALKAFLLGHGHRSVPIHSVAQLAERCAQLDPAFAVHITAGRVLDQYDIPTRYPDALAPPAVPFESYTQEQAKTAVAAAQATVALVAQNLRPATER
ncbi:MAG TPA: HEPN domain-containing protein [Alphaproteobacteria bacterium]|nr:HEPN domain-containing protein [Alphaproteobacteria bacterium]